MLHFNTPQTRRDEENALTRRFVLIFQSPSGLAGPLYVTPPSVEIRVKSHNPPGTRLLDDSSNLLLPERHITVIMLSGFQLLHTAAADIGFLRLMSLGSLNLNSSKYQFFLLLLFF